MPSTSIVTPEPVGDVAVVVRLAGGSAGESLRRVRTVAEALTRSAMPGVVDVVGSPGRVTVAYAPLAIEGLERLRARVAAIASEAAEPGAAAAVTHEIPVAYDGPDLAEMCDRVGLERARFVVAHAEPDYLVEAIGFLPGFGYLAGLPAALAIPRRSTPRRRVPANAVGIGGDRTGIYPCASPGGWNLVGRAEARLFDPGRARPALLGVGDRVRFVAADLPPSAAEPVAEPPPPATATITVLEPGLFTTIQDLGRPGQRAGGVPLSGAADVVALRLANLLVGNDEDAAGIECTLLGPTLRFERSATVAVVGGTFPGLPAGVAVSVAAGQVITFGHAVAGCRGCLAVAGGIDVPRVLGSRSTLVAAGFGGVAGRPLRAGDRLAVAAEPRRPRAVRFGPRPDAAAGGSRVLRVVPGEQAKAFGPAVWSRTFRASSRSDRMGVRLEGAPLATPPAAAASVAVFPGTVQVPPDGQPIILLCDGQTIGGYAVLGQVIMADLPVVAQLRPGDEIRWRPVSLAEAHAALREREAVLAGLREAVR